MIRTRRATLCGCGVVVAGAPPPPPPPVMMLKDDPMFAKYFKMLKFGLPISACKQKMAAEGMDPNVRTPHVSLMSHAPRHELCCVCFSTARGKHKPLVLSFSLVGALFF
jgi:hypothetical protein